MVRERGRLRKEVVTAFRPPTNTCEQENILVPSANRGESNEEGPNPNSNDKIE